MNRDCASILCQDALIEAGLVMMGSGLDSHAGLTYYGCIERQFESRLCPVVCGVGRLFLCVSE